MYIHICIDCIEIYTSLIHTYCIGIMRCGTEKLSEFGDHLIAAGIVPV